MTQVPTTDAWRHWLRMERDPTEESGSSHCFPVMSPFPPHDWMVFKPFTDTYMVVPNDEYRAEWDSKHAQSSISNAPRSTP